MTFLVILATMAITCGGKPVRHKSECEQLPSESGINESDQDPTRTWFGVRDEDGSGSV